MGEGMGMGEGRREVGGSEWSLVGRAAPRENIGEGREERRDDHPTPSHRRHLVQTLAREHQRKLRNRTEPCGSL